MSVEPYEPADEYNVGDVVEHYRTGTDGQRITYVCRRYHAFFEPNAKPYTIGMMPDHPLYEEGVIINGIAYHIRSPFWEPIFPEWSEYEVYEEDDICQYNGFNYVLTWRGAYEYDPATATYVETIKIGPPDVTEDEDGVRIWALNYGRVSGDLSSFALCPFHLERSWDDEYTQNQAYSPYHPLEGGGLDDSESSDFWYKGLGTQQRRNGGSMEVFQNYEQHDREVTKDGVPFGPLLTWPVGISPAGKCGCAFQRQGESIGFAGRLGVVRLYNDPENLGLYGNLDFYNDPWKFQGQGFPSPYFPVSGIFTEDVEFDNYPFPFGSDTPEADNVGRLFYWHNHPLFFRREVESVYVTLTTPVQWIKREEVYRDAIDPAYFDYILVDDTLSRRDMIRYKVMMPNDDCMSSLLVSAFIRMLFYPEYEMPENKNILGKMFLPTGDMTRTNEVYDRWDIVRPHRNIPDNRPNELPEHFRVVTEND